MGHKASSSISKELNNLDTEYRKLEEESNTFNEKASQELRRSSRLVCGKTKGETQKMDNECSNNKPRSATRSGNIRGVVKHSTTKTPRKSKASKIIYDELDRLVEENKQLDIKKRTLNEEACQDLRKSFKQICDKTKRETQKMENERSIKKPRGTTRSGNIRGVTKRPIYSDGKWVTKGIEESQEKFDDAELEYLKKMVEKVKEVSGLRLEYLKYLICDVLIDELKGIKAGEIQSRFHKEYLNLKGKGKSSLRSKVRTSLFTNEQKDYINGLLQGAFDTTSKDANGDIKHSDMDYVGLVMLAEATTRVVKYVHRFDSVEETLTYMKKHSLQALGYDDLDDEDLDDEDDSEDCEVDVLTL